MNPASIDFKDYLLAYSELSSAEIDFTLGTNLFVGILPDSSSGICTCLFESPGMTPDPNDIRRPSIQVLTRGIAGGYNSAYLEIETICNLFHELTNETINSTRYIQVRKTGDIAHVGDDAKGRPIFSCTLSAMRT